MREYVLFECSECHSLIAYPIETADGRACSECNGYIIPRNKGTKEELKELYGDNIIYPGRKILSFNLDLVTRRGGIQNRNFENLT